MRKAFLFLTALLMMVGNVMAQTPVLELTADQIGTTYPYQLSDDDAQKVYDLENLTVAVRINTPSSMNTRKALFAISDPTMEKNTAAEGAGSRYVAYGIYNGGPAYLASWRDTDRFSGNKNAIPFDKEDVIVTYVINTTGNVVSLYVNGVKDKEWSGNSGFGSGYEMATPGMVKEDHSNANIYLGGGVSSEGNGEVFNGEITGVKVYSGALSASEIAAINFDDPILLAQAREEFNAAYASAQTILNEANLSLSGTDLPLQTTDQSGAFYIWASNPESNEGPISNLVDGEKTISSFFHTSWSANIGQGPHYIEVDLGEANKLSEFMFKYTTRIFQGSPGQDYLDGISVLGSNDKSTYTEIYNVTSGFPQASGRDWNSSLISSETAYRYLRFNVTAERIYWHMAEFDIVKDINISVAGKYTNVKKEVAKLKTLYDTHSNNTVYDLSKLSAATAALNALIESINAGTIFSYETLDKPTFAQGGNTTKVAMVKLNGENLEGFTYTQGQTTRFNMPQVVAGQTYNLDLTYEMAWGDLAIFQIDKNSNEKKYGYYTCGWEVNASPFGILVRDNSDFMCQELEIPSIESLEAISANDATYLTIPYKITIPENLEAGDVVVVRVMVGVEENGAYNANNITEGGCLDLVFEVKEPDADLTVNLSPISDTDHLLYGLIGYIGTFSAPYPTVIPENVTAYYASYENKDELNGAQIISLTPIEEHATTECHGVPAEFGVVLVASPDYQNLVDGKAVVTMNRTKLRVETPANNAFSHSASNTVLIGAGDYILANGSEGIGFYESNPGTLAMNKAFLRLGSSNTSNVSAFRLVVDETVTGINGVATERADAPIYDLSGRRVLNTVKGGIYIQNGKKFIVK